MSAAKQAAAAAARADRISELRGDIRSQLEVLRKLHGHLEELADTRQSVGLGFMTAEARELANKQAQLDRAAARGIAGRIEDPGLTWMNTTTVLGTGQVPAPVTVAAVSASAEILFTLRHHVRRLARPAAAAAAAAVPGGRGRLPVGLPTTDADVDGLTRHLEDLVEVCVSRKVLEHLLRELDHLERIAADVVDGPARTNHPEPCPWCGQKSLVIHHRMPGRAAGVIRCEGDHPCECDWQWCDCHRNPTRNRHEWVNSGRAAHTWNELSNLQTTRKEIAHMETKALDALERIRHLHQPTWVLADGSEKPAVVELTDLPPTVAATHACGDRCYTLPATDVDAGLTVHALPVCTACGDPEALTDHTWTGDGTYSGQPVLYPCPTIRALELDQPAGDTTDTTEEH